MIAIEVDAVFDGEHFLCDGAVVIVDGRQIRSVNPRGTELPAGCELLQLPGTTLLPGLIDMHVHLCCDSGPDALDRIPEFSDAELVTVIEDALAAHLRSGVTTVRDLGDREWAVIDWRDRNRESAFPTVLGSGPPITSSRGHCWNMGGEARGVEQLRRAVAERAERGADIVKIMASGGANTPGSDPAGVQFDVAEIQAVVDESHARGLGVTAHAHSLAAIKNAVAAGIDGIEHCTFVTAGGIDVAGSVVADLVASGTTVCPTLGIVPGATPAPRVLEMMRKTGMSLGQRNQTMAGLHSAGVRIVSGSDGGITAGKPHGIMPEAVIGLVDGGVSLAEALATATSRAAAACGLADRKGRVLAGYDADLVVVQGDLRAGVTSLRDVRAVFLRGIRA
jgi:imidazolonepropionase-like amidohydrolase